MKEDKKIKNIIIIACIIIVLTIIGLLIATKTKDKPNKKDPIINEEKLANTILTDLNIDNYLGQVLMPTIELNKNILDTGSNKNMQMYFYSNDNLVKYTLISYDTNKQFGFVKYDEYEKEHKRVFNKEPDLTSDYDMGASLTFGISDFPKDPSNDYQIKTNETTACDQNNLNNCFVMLIDKSVTMNRAQFSELKIKNNIIAGKIRQYIETEGSEAYLDASFEFEYEKINKKYIAKNLKITSVADAYNE